MDQKIKNILGWVSILAVLVLIYGIFSFTNSYSLRSASMSSGFGVTGVGEVTAVPDVAVFSFSVLTQGGLNLSDLQEQNITKMNNAIDFIKSLDVEDEDIKTSQLDISPRYSRVDCSRSNELCNPSEIIGYSVNQTVTVKIRDFEDLREAFVGVVENGANNVYGLQFTIDDPTELENEARAMAMAQAREKAEAVAKAGGFKLGKLISVEESTPRTSILLGRGGMAETASFDSKDQAIVPQIEAGSEEINVQVYLRYEIR